MQIFLILFNNIHLATLDFFFIAKTTPTTIATTTAITIPAIAPPDNPLLVVGTGSFPLLFGLEYFLPSTIISRSLLFYTVGALESGSVAELNVKSPSPLTSTV